MNGAAGDGVQGEDAGASQTGEMADAQAAGGCQEQLTNEELIPRRVAQEERAVVSLRAHQIQDQVVVSAEIAGQRVPLQYYPVDKLPRKKTSIELVQHPAAISYPKHGIDAGKLKAILPRKSRRKEAEYNEELSALPRQMKLETEVPEVVYSPWSEDHAEVRLPLKEASVTPAADEMLLTSALPKPLVDTEIPQIYRRADEDDAALPRNQAAPSPKLSWGSALPKPAGAAPFMGTQAFRDALDPELLKLLPSQGYAGWIDQGSDSNSGCGCVLLPRSATKVTERVTTLVEQEEENSGVRTDTSELVSSMLLSRPMPPRRPSWSTALPKPVISKPEFPVCDTLFDPRLLELLPSKSITSWTMTDDIAAKKEERPAADVLVPRRCMKNIDRSWGIILPLESRVVESAAAIATAASQSGDASLPRRRSKL